MKILAQVTAIAFLLGQPYVQADDSHHPLQGKEIGASSSASPTAPGMGMMDMNQMQKTMERIQQSKNSAERQRLMQEHMDQMQKMMGDMHGMMGKGMGGAMSADDRQQMMEKRMDMMQGMMEQMIKHMMVSDGTKQSGSKGEGTIDNHDHDL